METFGADRLRNRRTLPRAEPSLSATRPTAACQSNMSDPEFAKGFLPLLGSNSRTRRARVLCRKASNSSLAAGIGSLACLKLSDSDDGSRVQRKKAESEAQPTHTVEATGLKRLRHAAKTAWR